ncbi:MAG: hypothetical protein HGA31_06700 [Candidatus Moranbacteria bacterium]|nr:hypothetical protein [Candidatus Moranbacteria bacterium]
MIAIVLFWVGLVASVVTGIGSWFTSGDSKRGVVAFPIALLLAAAVAKYIGL